MCNLLFHTALFSFYWLTPEHIYKQTLYFESLGVDIEDEGVTTWERVY